MLRAIKVRFYPSSKTCSCCGYINNELKLSDREWFCSDCGIIHDRDFNAAINIKNEGLKIYIKNKIPIRNRKSNTLESSHKTLDELVN